MASSAPLRTTPQTTSTKPTCRSDQRVSHQHCRRRRSPQPRDRNRLAQQIHQKAQPHSHICALGHNRQQLASNRLWERTERVFGPLFEARDADTGVGVHLMMAALIRARREQTYEVESLSLMLTSEHWIPVEGVHELPLIQALVAQQRRFLKPLRYDARSVSEFANALLLDAGRAAVPLHLLSPFMAPAERAAKERAIAAMGPAAWVWCNVDLMPSLPAPLIPIVG
ncbi:MAG: DUF1173 family protein [Rubrivivax sp.]|nr:DUF1173 family protein [Rubrivivax sp.]